MIGDTYVLYLVTGDHKKIPRLILYTQMEAIRSRPASELVTQINIVPLLRYSAEGWLLCKKIY
jgi:hypothetical protein